MAGMSPEKLAEVKERLLDWKRLWQEVKQQLKSNIGDGYQEMLAAARDEEDQATVSLMAETNLTLLGPKRQETGGHRRGHEPHRERQLRVL